MAIHRWHCTLCQKRFMKLATVLPLLPFQAFSPKKPCQCKHHLDSRLHYGENSTELVGFKEQKKYFEFKTPQT
jgi:hypothetical protein